MIVTLTETIDTVPKLEAAVNVIIEILLYNMMLVESIWGHAHYANGSAEHSVLLQCRHQICMTFNDHELSVFLKLTQ